jgi:8-oxo-dGTP pyrophosphatase MutT (NUDIX family)
VTEQNRESGFLRHIRACNSAVLPGQRQSFHVGGHRVGWVLPALADVLAAYPAIQRTAGQVILTHPATLPAIGRDLADRGFYRWREEAFDVRAPDGTVLTTIDRGALPSFGISAMGVHVNGLVRRPDGLHLWIGRRSRTKYLDPGKLDHLVAGGVPAGLTPEQTLIKEAAEEAAVPDTLARTATPASRISYAMERPEGLRRDQLRCYDLEVPAGFVPRGADGEVELFELWPIERVMATVRDTDDFKFNVNLVLIDLFLRERLIQGAAATELRAALDSGHG